MSSNKDRYSNFELLRLFSMFLIVLHHYGVHGVVDDNGTSLQSVATGMLTSFGKSGVFIFVLIGSFFLEDKKFKCSRIINLISSTFFYSMMILAVSLIFFRDKVTSIEIMRSLFFIPLNYWFVTDYIFLLLLIPFFNVLLKKIPKRKFEFLLLIGLIMLFVFPSIFGSASEYSSIDIFVFLYSLIVYLKKYDASIKLNRGLMLVLLILIAFCMVLPVYILAQYPNAIKSLGMNTLFFTRTNSILTLCFSIIIFMLIKNWHFKPVPLINFASKGALGIYLIHDNPIVRKLLWQAVNNKQYHGFSQIICMGLVISFLIFLICLGIEMIRNNCVDRLLKKIFLKIFSLKFRNRIDSILND